MITSERITKSNIRERAERVSERDGAARCFFGNFAVMHNFLNLNGTELHVIGNGKEEYLAVYKPSKKEYRFLFASPSQEFVSELLAERKCRYLASNFLAERTGKEFWIEESEMILDVDSVLRMEDHDFRKQYRRANRKNPPFEISSYEYGNDLADIVAFLETWRWSRTPEQNDIAIIENDLNFLASFGRDAFTRGVVIRHEDRIVAFCLYVGYFGGACTSVSSKILRGYESLGVVLTVEKCRAMKADGFNTAYLANMNNDFKKSLHWAGRTIALYAERIHKDEGMSFMTIPERYLNSVTR